MIGGCTGPESSWTWTRRTWEELDKNGDPTGSISGVDYSICPDCSQMWERYGLRTPIPMPVAAEHLDYFRTTA